MTNRTSAHPTPVDTRQTLAPRVHQTLRAAGRSRRRHPVGARHGRHVGRLRRSRRRRVPSHRLFVHVRRQRPLRHDHPRRPDQLRHLRRGTNRDRPAEVVAPAAVTARRVRRTVARSHSHPSGPASSDCSIDATSRSSPTSAPCWRRPRRPPTRTRPTDRHSSSPTTINSQSGSRRRPRERRPAGEVASPTCCSTTTVATRCSPASRWPATP